jgi:Flp pilus assembly protein TadB
VGWTGRVGRPLARRIGADRVLSPGLRADLLVIGVDQEVHLAEMLTAALIGLALPGVLAAVLAASGLSLPPALPVLAGIVLAVVGWVAPGPARRAEAAALRRGVRDAFATFLSLVAIGLAGQAGIEQALRAAAARGQTQGHRLIRQALTDATLAGLPPWDALEQLGAFYQVDDIVDTATTVRLAGQDGARIRASLTAKAGTIRGRQRAEIEADTAANTERMTLPVVVLSIGYLLLIGFPAVSRVLNGF